MISGDMSFGEGLSSLNVGDLLREFDDKSLLNDLDSGVSFGNGSNVQRSRKPDPDYDVRRGIYQLSKKADSCDRLFDSITSERMGRAPGGNNGSNSQANAVYSSESTLWRELASIRENQSRIFQTLEAIQMQIGAILPSPGGRQGSGNGVAPRHSQLAAPAGSGPNSMGASGFYPMPTATNTYGSVAAPLSAWQNGNEGSSSSNSSGPYSTAGPNSASVGNPSDSKYKDLKKKLLMANLKILDLQNRAGKNNDK